jgi:GTP cyclohydrolase III
MSEPVFVLIDGDNVGDRIDGFIHQGDLNSLSEFTRRLDQAVARIATLAQEAGGEVYMAGGDNILVRVKGLEKLLDKVLSIREELPCTFSVGIGSDARESHQALRFAKERGAGTIVRFLRWKEGRNITKW